MTKQEIYEGKLNTLTEKLNSALINIELVNIKTGELETIDSISKIAYTVSGIDITATVNDKTYMLNKAFGKVFEPSEAYTKALTDFQADFDNLVSANNDWAAEIEAKHKEELAKKAEEKRLQQIEEKKNNAVNNLTSAATRVRMKADYYTAQYYKTLGFIAKHAKKISAAMPDYIEDWFVGVFGDVERRVVDSSKKSPAGWIEQWGLSLTIDLDTADIPKFLRDYMSKSKNKSQIANTAFVFDIMSTYGFKFGKSQDYETILNSIPETYQISFSEGYNE